jgi:hypothetical protein
MDPQVSQKAWGKVVAKAWSDEVFKKRLLSDPKAALKEHGIEVPVAKVVVVENTPQTVYFILPERPSEIGVDELDQVAAGLTGAQYTHWRR